MSETETAPAVVSSDNSGKMARNITTKFFGGKTVAMKRVRKGPGIDWLGQIIGHVFATKDKTSLDNEGKTMHSIELIGDFEAVNFATGEVLSAPSAYLPSYFAEHAKAAVAASGKPILFAVEVGVESIPETDARGAILYTWVVKNQMEKPADDPLAALKRQMKARGILKLPEPVAGPVMQIEHDATDVPAEVAEEAAAEHAPRKGKGKAA